MGDRRLEQVKGFRMPARYRVVALTIWPGLAQIWSGQEALGLLLGVCFASAFNLAVVTRWIWTEVFPPGWADFFLVLARSVVDRLPGLHVLVDRIVPP